MASIRAVGKELKQSSHLAVSYFCCGVSLSKLPSVSESGFLLLKISFTLKHV